LRFEDAIWPRNTNFLYLGTYQRNVEGEVSGITYAVNKPDMPYNDYTRDMKSVRFHLETIKFGELLKYPALIETAYAKIIEQLLMRRRFAPAVMKDFVDWIHGPTKICKDEDSLLEQLVVTAAIAHEYKHWNDGQRKEFINFVQHHPDFSLSLTTARDANKKLLEAPQEYRKKDELKRRRFNGP
jgi:hypothetical protein